MKHTLTLVRSTPVAAATMAFYWEKPANFTFTAGQFGDFTLPHPAETDAEGNTRAFSFITAPHEPQLGVATRMRDTAFKRSLQQLKPGDQIVLDGPTGDLRLHNNAARAAIFLTGGIGITPVRSILVDAAHRNVSHAIRVFYCNRRPEDAAFLQELEALQRQLPNYQLIPTMTQPATAKQPWSGETGHLTADVLRRHTAGAANPIYYVTGPERMVRAMNELLAKLGVDRDDVRTEEFPGYP